MGMSRRDNPEEKRVLDKSFYPHVHEIYKDADDENPEVELDFSGEAASDIIRKSDRILNDITQKLKANRNLDASFIEISVVDDEVHMQGEVETRQSKWLAEDLAGEVPGVKIIINQIKVRTLS